MSTTLLTVYRLVVPGQNPERPVSSPEGRFHHDGQPAIYTSLTPEGTRVAIARYAGDGVERDLWTLEIAVSHLSDHSGDPALSVVWQDLRQTGAASPTWQLSDKARAEGAEAMLYSSRSRPDLTHCVLFEPKVIRASHRLAL
ncbi:RES family NAD+ phosphorylase [Celeribacter sp. SCSIO 80788]|uniref:RES family NAD+ phosphorylase n=1 Tax=Celeribacter sp. SCSIO 80788 TaxID=3117013 RepID=UPI003DA5BA7E